MARKLSMNVREARLLRSDARRLEAVAKHLRLRAQGLMREDKIIQRIVDDHDSPLNQKLDALKVVARQEPLPMDDLLSENDLGKGGG